MKTTMKYAGIAAMTLVALSPVISVVTPFNMVTVVQAENEEIFDKVDIQFPSEIYVEEGSKVKEILNVDDSNLYGRIVDVNNPQYSIEANKFGLWAPYNKIYLTDYISSNAWKDLGVDDTFTLEYGPVIYRMYQMYFEPNALFKKFFSLGSHDITTNGISGGHYHIRYGDGRVEVAQKIVIGQDPDEKENENNENTTPPKPEVISGTVTTHSDKSKYSIYDDNNSDAEHRSLGANSSWRTDRVRTIDGIKQYRVSTHGWVNASDVTYIPDGEMNSKLIVTKLNTPIEIHVSDEHPHHSLQNVDREFITHRALDAGTNWMVDKIGTDTHGRIYYGVSTNEFIHNSYGVSVVK
ncbi:hypothetical protein [Companilactobacillus keshanensis]|uniref:Surface layer protein A domain-containing protein n=1 Tax=Companilactobacillus keshanensis TaxID=2486003 RepID=A0ABW4BWF7_9LACO|nr:hypothetical protein [Companilactobacillus keshanensis]